MNSETYLTGFRNHFVKLRISYPRADATACQKDIAEFLEQLKVIVL